MPIKTASLSQIRKAALEQGLVIRRSRRCAEVSLYCLIDRRTNTVVYPGNHPFQGVSLDQVREFLEAF